MTKHSPLAPSTAPLPATDRLAFTPVPRQRMRRGGWSAERQRAFIASLAETGSVRAACRRMGVGEHHIYKLRAHPEGASFRRAWEAALDCGIARIEDTAMDRALYGIEDPVFWQGEKVGTRRRYNDRLLMFLLANRAPDRFARGANGRITGKSSDWIDPDRLAREQRKWRKAWEAEQKHVSAADVRASIDRKVERLRQHIEAERAAAWARLSQETRAAWAQFAALRDRDLDAAGASAETREQVNVSPLHDADGRPRVKQFVPIKPPPPPPPPKTEWTVRDESFDP